MERMFKITGTMRCITKCCHWKFFLAQTPGLKSAFERGCGEGQWSLQWGHQRFPVNVKAGGHAALGLTTGSSRSGKEKPCLMNKSMHRTPRHMQRIWGQSSQQPSCEKATDGCERQTLPVRVSPIGCHVGGISPRGVCGSLVFPSSLAYGL